ncbi:MAG: hypothetical protein R2734_11950 [Nocardioides sp.]
MSVRQALLALLEQGPIGWLPAPLGVRAADRGHLAAERRQVHTTLARLERDGLVEGTGVDDEGHVIYRATTAGRAEVSAWFTTPVPRPSPRATSWPSSWPSP